MHEVDRSANFCLPFREIILRRSSVIGWNLSLRMESLNEELLAWSAVNKERM
jgi:hypothetical protein